MNLMYTIKCIRADNSQYCHPCCGAYEIIADESADCSGHSVVYDCDSSVHFSTRDFVAIYIENASGATINRVYAPEPGPRNGGAGYRPAGRPQEPVGSA